MYQSVHASLPHCTLFCATEFRESKRDRLARFLFPLSSIPLFVFGRSPLFPSRYASPEPPLPLLLFRERGVFANVPLIELEQVEETKFEG